MAEFDHAAFAQKNVSDFLANNRAERDDEAEFALPEAVATAVGAGFILGPIGGLLLGAAQGILGKRMEQSELDAIAAYDDVDATFMETIDRQMMEADSPEDVEQLSTMATQQTAARRMLASPVPQIRQQGAMLQAKLFDAQRAYAIKQEEQAIQADVRAENTERELGQENYSRFRTARDKFMQESAPFLEVRNATANILNALQRGSPVDQYAAAKLMDKALDPTSVVRPEEAEAWGQIGSVWQRANVFMEKLRSGQTLAPEQAAEMEALARSIENQSYEMQIAREARYADEIDDIGLPVKYHDNFRLATPLPAPERRTPSPAPAANNSTPSAAQVAVAAGMAGADVLEAVPSEVKTGAAAAGGLTVARWAPALTKFAAKFGVPLAAVIAAGEQVEGESDEAYRRRLRRTMESTPYDERRRPTN